MKNFIYKICSSSEWHRFKKKKIFLGTKQDLLDGYIHLSKKNQVKSTLQKYYFKKDNLVLLEVDTSNLKNLVWEKSSEKIIFPHLYSYLNLKSIKKVLELNMKLKKNTVAPNFKLPSTDDSIFELKKNKKKNIILYFYPKDDTPGCTIESKDFSKLNNLISKKNTIVFGISKDSIESHLKFKNKYKLKFNLLSDEKLSVIKKYGVWGKKSFLGKKYMGIVRTTFLIQSKGKIHKIWSNVRVKDHAKEVLKELKNI